VRVGDTARVPLVAFVPLQPPAAVQKVALVEDQVTVEIWPGVMLAGLADNVTLGVVAAKAAPGKEMQRKNTKEKLRVAARMIFWGIVMRVDGDGVSDAASAPGRASIKGESPIIEASAVASRALALAP
jgi:hypothetical protein